MINDVFGYQLPYAGWFMGTNILCFNKLYMNWKQLY